MLPPNPRIGYAIAVATTAAVVLLRLVLDRAAGGDVPDFLLPFVLPVILAGWYGGLRCGLLATLLNALAAVYFFTDPAYSWGIAGSGDRVRVGTFVVVGAVVSWLNELLHRYRRRAEDAARTALRRQQELEREVADRRDAERLLTASQGQLRLVTDHAPVLLVHCDSDRRFAFVNGPYAERFGLEPKDVVGKTIPEVLGEAAYERLRPHVEAALAGRRVEFEVEIPYPKLGRRTMHCVYRPEFDGAGRVEGFVAAITDATERVRAEAYLRESEERYRVLTEALPHMVWTMRPDLTLEFLNRLSSEFTGLSVGEVNAGGWGRLVHPDDLPGMTAAVAGPLGRGEPHEAEYRFRHHAGEYRWVVSRAVPIKDGAGAVVKWVGSTSDIHDRKLAEDRLRASERRYRALVLATPQAVWTADGTEGGAAGWWLELTGQTGDEAAGWGWLDALHPDDRERVRATWTHAHENRVLYDAEYRVRTRSGEYRHFAARGVALTDPDGILEEWVGTLTDIHEGKLAEERLRELNATLERRVAERTAALRESEERFRSAFEFAPIGIALVAPDGRWLRVNRSLCELVGYAEPELLATDFQAITHPDDLDADLGHVRGMLAGTVRTYQMEKRYFHRRGHVVHVLLSVSLVRGAAGEPLYFISQVKDITQRKEAEERLRASLREKEVLLKEIHHRVKNNLQIVSTLLDLQSDHTADPDALEMFRDSRGRVKSMALIHERLYRSQDMARVDFAEYVRQLTDDLYHTYKVSDDDIRLELAVDIPPLPIDIAVPCGLLLNELMSNCFKHAFKDVPEGRVRVSLRRGGDDANVLTVSDDGAGFPAGADFRNTTSFGLQLVNTLVDQLDGEIELAAGRGTTFTVRFPRIKK